MEREAYQRERDTLTSELSSLRVEEDLSAVLEQTAALLANMPLAWNQADQEQRNRLARLLFESVVIMDRTVEAAKPREEFVPFFLLDCHARQQYNGSEEPSSTRVLSGGSDGAAAS